MTSLGRGVTRGDIRLTKFHPLAPRRPTVLSPQPSPSCHHIINQSQPSEALYPQPATEVTALSLALYICVKISRLTERSHRGFHSSRLRWCAILQPSGGLNTSIRLSTSPTQLWTCLISSSFTTPAHRFRRFPVSHGSFCLHSRTKKYPPMSPSRS